MNNYIVRSYRDVIVITKFAITKYAIRRASKAQSIVMFKKKKMQSCITTGGGQIFRMECYKEKLQHS